MNKKEYMQTFCDLVEASFELETDFVCDDCYEDSPLVVVYPYTVEEVGHPNYNHYRIDIETYDDKFWFNYLHYTVAYNLTRPETGESQIDDLNNLQHALFKAIKEIMNESGIQKELLPELKYRQTQEN